MAKRQSELRGCLGGLGYEESTLGCCVYVCVCVCVCVRGCGTNRTAGDESTKSPRGQNVHWGTL